MALTEEEKARRKRINKPILKYGCLPIIIIFSIIMLIQIFKGNSIEIDQTGQDFDPKVAVREFCVWSIDKLTDKYGEPNVNEMEKSNDFQWILNKEKGLKVSVFTNKNNESEVVRFHNIDLGTFFWDNLGWDKNNLETNKIGQYDIISDLNGIDEAMYKHQQHILNVKLKPVRYFNSFGKK